MFKGLIKQIVLLREHSYAFRHFITPIIGLHYKHLGVCVITFRYVKMVLRSVTCIDIVYKIQS